MPFRIEAVRRGVLINHVSLITQAAVFKPRMVCDFREEKRKIINLSGGLVDWWAEFTPKLIGKMIYKALADFVSHWRIRLLG